MSWRLYDVLPEGFEHLRDELGNLIRRDPVGGEWVWGGDGVAFQVNFRWATPDPIYILKPCQRSEELP